MDRDEVDKLAKTEKRPIYSNVEQTSLGNRGFILWPDKLFAEIKRESREGKMEGAFEI